MLIFACHTDAGLIYLRLTSDGGLSSAHVHLSSIGPHLFSNTSER